MCKPCLRTGVNSVSGLYTKRDTPGTVRIIKEDGAPTGALLALPTPAGVRPFELTFSSLSSKSFSPADRRVHSRALRRVDPACRGRSCPVDRSKYCDR